MPKPIAIPPDLDLADPRACYRRGYRDALRRRASGGGKARNRSLTPERRREIARNAVNARWDKAMRAALAAGEAL